MRQKKNNFFKFLKEGLIVLSLFIGLFVFAQTIDYPVAELDDCQNREDCRQYCNNLSNAENCLNFAENNNLFTDKELAEARKVVNALSQNFKFPGNCQSQSACDDYCSRRENARECFNFGKEAGLIPVGEITKAERALSFIERGETPGGCILKVECDVYCGRKENFEECVDFLVKIGEINKEEAETVKKTDGIGPGGCKTKQECDVFCEDPANELICFEFGKEHGLIPQDIIIKVERDVQEMQRQILSASPEIINCLNNRLGLDTVEKIKNGNFLPNPEIGNAMRICFEQYVPPAGERDKPL